MNKYNISIILILSAFFALSIFAYQKENKPLQLANSAIASIDLRNFDQRGVHTKKSVPNQLRTADLCFEKQPLKAVGIYRDLLRQDPGNLDLHIRLGMLSLKQQQYEAAREHLHMVYEVKEAALQPDASWFLALLAIIEQDEDYAKKLLEESLEARSQYQEQAEILYQALN
jgi:tetratricopeptide (TPR) repeat protein